MSAPLRTGAPGGGGGRTPSSRDVLAAQPSAEEVRASLQTLHFYFRQLGFNIQQLMRQIAEGTGDAKQILATYSLVAAKQQGLAEELARSYDVLKATDVLPTSRLPTTGFVANGQQQQQPQELLEMLMRKKPEVGVLDWMRDAHDNLLKVARCDEGRNNAAAPMSVDDWEALWAWAPSVAARHSARFRERLDADSDIDGADDDDDDDGDDDDEGEKKKEKEGEDADMLDGKARSDDLEDGGDPIPLDQMLRYLHTGLVPATGFK